MVHTRSVTKISMQDSYMVKADLGMVMYNMYVKLKVWIWTIHGLPAQSTDPYFERAIHGLSAQSKD